MRILHLAAGNRWTGAAAPAFAEVEALRAAGHDAHYAYVGGYKLQAKLAQCDFAHPVIQKAQNPVTFVRSIRGIERLMHTHGFDVLHAHLTYDHWLARVISRSHDVRIARTYHARRVLRTDPLSRALLRNTQHVFVINRAFDLPGVVFTPPAVDHRQFHPDGLRIDVAGPLVTVIGKLSRNRGFEEALHTFAALRQLTPCRLMIIGHGEHRPALEALVGELGLGAHVVFAGYHEDDLAEHYRASDLLLFTARGSDEGHRAVLEAMACGVPVATMPIEGVDALVPRDWIAASSDPAALAATAAAMLAHPPADAYERSLEFGYDRAASRLLDAYQSSPSLSSRA